MKKITFILFSVLLSFAAMATDWNGSTATDFGTQAANAGESEENPIIITTPMQWMYAAGLSLADANRSKKFALGDDLNFKNLAGAKSFGPLTAGAVFDGKGFTISNIVLNSTTEVQGLFTTVTSGTVKNLGLTGTGSIIGLSYSGGIVCTAVSSTISNCYNTTSVSGDIVSAQDANKKAFGIGGIVGTCNGSTIEDCYNTGTITGVGRVAGIVGYLITSHNSVIKRCYNNGIISGVYRSGANNYGDCGGILGANVSYSVTIESCYNTGNISVAGFSGKNSYVGGIQGTQTPGSTINNCFNTGTISLDNSNNPTPAGITAAGGIAGVCRQDVTNCYNTGTVQVVAGPSVNSKGGINGGGSVDIPVNCFTLTGTDYNDMNASTPRIKTALELQDSSFVATLNNGQDPAKWKADYGTPINGGYPILTYMVSKSLLPDPPTDVIATMGDLQATVSFTAPVYTGGSAIIDYTIIPYVGKVAGTSVTGTSSPIIVTGLSNGTTYSFTVTARNSYGSSAPKGTVVEEIPDPTDTIYVEVARDYINSLNFNALDVVGQLVPPLKTEISGLPINYIFLVNNDVDLANVSFSYILPAGTTLESTMPTDFSIVSKQTVLLKSSWGARKVYITIKKIKPSTSDLDLKFDAIKNTNSWTEDTEGWIANGISTTVTTKAQFASENSALIVAATSTMKHLSYDISMETSGFTGMFTVESSGNGTEWISLNHFNSCNVISSTVTSIENDLPENTKYVRFVYDCSNGSEAVNVNNIQMDNTINSIVDHQIAGMLKIFPNPAHSQFTISDASSLKELSIYSVSGMLMKKISNICSVIDVTDLKQGLYLIKSEAISGSVSVTPLIIQ